MQVDSIEPDITRTTAAFSHEIYSRKAFAARHRVRFRSGQLLLLERRGYSGAAFPDPPHSQAKLVWVVSGVSSMSSSICARVPHIPLMVLGRAHISPLRLLYDPGGSPTASAPSPTTPTCSNKVVPLAPEAERIRRDDPALPFPGRSPSRSFRPKTQLPYLREIRCSRSRQPAGKPCLTTHPFVVYSP
jgi:hypothetical protein